MNDELPIRLNLGCGGDPLPNFANVDMESLEHIRLRYPNQEFAHHLVVVQHNILTCLTQKI